MAEARAGVTRPAGWPATAEPWPEWAGERLGRAFFDRPTEAVARELVGCLLVSAVDGVVTGGRIVETEAYLGAHDPGSHAATKGVTGRNRVMYGPPGHAYVYFTYGAHHMLNLVTESEGVAGAVLIRALEPLLGLKAMRARRGSRADRDLANGPGKVAAALGLTLRENEALLDGPVLAVFAGPPPTGGIASSGRVGLSAGHELPLRFFAEGDGSVSRGRTGPPKQRPRP